MKNLVFVIWMIGFPISRAIASYLYFLTGEKVVMPDNIATTSALIFLAIWGGIGYLLFEGANRPKK